MDLLLALTLMGNLVVALFIMLCAGLILIILLQKGRGGGLSGAFGGGAGAAGSLLGTKTGDFLTWVTIALVAGFLVLAVLMGKFLGRPEASSELSSRPTSAAQETTAAETEETTAPVTGTEAVDEATEAATEKVDEAAEEVTEKVDEAVGEVTQPEPVEEKAVEAETEAAVEAESTPIPAEKLAEEMLN